VKPEGKSNSTQEIEDLIRARYPLIYIVSSEEERVESELEKIVVDRRNRKLIVWSITEGFFSRGGGEVYPDYDQPLKALNFILSYEDDCVFVLRDFHPYLQAPEVTRRLRDLSRALKSKRKNIILLSSVFRCPGEIEKDLSVVDFAVPDRPTIGTIIDSFMGHIGDDTPSLVRDDPKFRDRVIEAALGLTADEIENVFAKSWIRMRDFHIPTILNEKRHIIRKSGILEYYESDYDITDIGGLEALKEWLRKRENAFYPEARRYGLPLPKGILLLGIPGCGKSLTAKSIGALYKMPLLRLDMGKVMGGIVGSSEENMRKVINTAEAVAPSILWMDELEKGLSGSASSGVSDGGTTARVFGTFITWLQEKDQPVFVIATANDVSQLPPELLRKGRFDEIFFVDLPTAAEREEIIKIHLRRKGRSPEYFDVPKIVAAMSAFSGSEIEQAIVSAMYDVYDEYRGEKDIDTESIIQSAQEIIPLSYTMKEKIDALREWAKTRARRASEAASHDDDSSVVRRLEL
jgi:ATP-dependent 26S proteasome regulatory subunit